MRKGALVIPAVAVQRGPQGTFVYVVGGDGKAELRPVRSNGIEGEDAIVASGPRRRASSVVIEGQNQLRPGAKVQTRQPPQGKPTWRRLAAGERKRP